MKVGSSGATLVADSVEAELSSWTTFCTSSARAVPRSRAVQKAVMLVYLILMASAVRSQDAANKRQWVRGKGQGAPQKGRERAKEGKGEREVGTQVVRESPKARESRELGRGRMLNVREVAEGLEEDANGPTCPFFFRPPSRGCCAENNY